jgi:hypothetical protein
LTEVTRSSKSPHSAVPRSRLAVFICSADNRRDVLERTLPSVIKFWPDCPYPFYVGVNSHGRPLPVGTPVIAPASQWHREFLLQLEQITEDYVVVILDDFLFRAPVDQTRLSDLVADVVARDLAYLRLVPLGRSLPARLSGQRPPELKPGIELIRARRPFYSSLQIAVWRRTHLLSMLRQPQSIWEFEHQWVPASVHCAIRDRPPIAYRHLVERGRWLPDARSLLQRAGLATDLGERPVWPNSRYARLFMDQVRWLVFGYATC